MSRILRCLVLVIFIFISKVNGEAFSVRISTENHVNEVDSRFVSFTIDPKYLFTSNEELSSKESTCMAASLTPAYLRIAGPSTSHITFNNKSMTIDHLDANLPEPNKHKRHLKRNEIDDYDSEESHEDILTKLKRSSDRLLRRHRRQLNSGSQETNKNEDEQKFKPKHKKSKLHALQHKELSDDEEEEKAKSRENESQESILSKLKKTRRGLIKNDDNEEEKEKSHEFESQESILSKLKQTRRGLIENNDKEEEKENSHEFESQESILSKLKKTRRGLIENNDKEEEKEKSHEFESGESIISKLKKTRLGLLKKKDQEESEERPKRLRRLTKDHLEVSHRQWKRFAKWAKDAGFSLVFAVNNGEKTETGMWDPNPALNMLTIADKDDVQEIYWQLGYECTNQTLEDYLNDLQTLRMMVDTFSARHWKVVGGDVSACLEAGSKSDFKDYVTLSADSMDAVLLNGNSSSQELARMSESSRLSLLRVLSTSNALWLTERPQQHSEQARAADWLTSLGYSARNGFHVHFRELLEKELYEPTLSFYMALLFKNLVGERVLDVTMEPSDGQAALFAHCTSLRHKEVPGAVTLYGVNMDSEPARFSVKLAKREDGGDIMQFILGHDHSGNIVVNGRPMFYEGNIRPVVKRVRPFKTLLLNLPPKTFGFWVLANTKVNACFDFDDKNNDTLVEAKPVEDIDKTKEKLDVDENKSKPTKETDDLKGNKIEKKQEDDMSEEKSKQKSRSRRSINLGDFDIDVTAVNDINNEDALRDRIDRINRGLRDVQGLIEVQDQLISNRVKRQISLEEFDDRRKLKRQSLKKGDRNNKYEHRLLGSSIFEKLRSSINGIKIPKFNLTKSLKELKSRKSKINMSKHSKRNSRNYRNREDLSEADEDDSKTRRKRSLLVNNKKRQEDKTEENEIELEDKKHSRFGKFLKKHKEMRDAIETDEDKSDYETDDHKSSKDIDAIEINTKITDDDAEFKIRENADHGLLKTAFENVLALLEELNHNLNKVWSALDIFD